ncbi:MAG: hypothetical protein PHQ19_00855 [Candidatus Krumholzibacteria bacterium]|nr:hypothetical protein [Candidatus Krumholzibacteria bacterium]
MKRFSTVAALALAMIAAACAARADARGRIYGRVTTADGETYEGMIRWDTNEISWIDVLDGTKKLDGPRHPRPGGDSKRIKKIRVFGIDIGSVRTSIDWDYTSARSGVAFGHIETLEATGGDVALVVLKSGERVELSSNSTDIGGSIRDIIVEDRTRGEIELEWNDLDTVEFMPAPHGLRSSFGDRLYGTVVSGKGDSFTGWICWDMDEVAAEDILDGEQRNRSRRIPFGTIASIERRSSSSARITLRNGDELVLRDTNDVDDGNRGITVFVKGLGRVVMDWDDFDRIDFEEPEAPAARDDFDGGRPIEGTVYTADGGSFSGRIRWDDDEQYTWELLDGELRGIEIDVEFGNIASIRRDGCCSALVTLADGTELRLSGTNDVDEGNKGIFVTRDDEEEVEISWEEFDRLELR